MLCGRLATAPLRQPYLDSLCGESRVNLSPRTRSIIFVIIMLQKLDRPVGVTVLLQPSDSLTASYIRLFYIPTRNCRRTST